MNTFEQTQMYCSRCKALKPTEFRGTCKHCPGKPKTDFCVCGCCKVCGKPEHQKPERLFRRLFQRFAASG